MQRTFSLDHSCHNSNFVSDRRSFPKGTNASSTDLITTMMKAMMTETKKTKRETEAESLKLTMMTTAARQRKKRTKKRRRAKSWSLIHRKRRIQIMRIIRRQRRMETIRMMVILVSFLNEYNTSSLY